MIIAVGPDVPSTKTCVDGDETPLHVTIHLKYLEKFKPVYVYEIDVAPLIPVQFTASTDSSH